MLGDELETGTLAFSALILGDLSTSQDFAGESWSSSAFFGLEIHSTAHRLVFRSRLSFS